MERRIELRAGETVFIDPSDVVGNSVRIDHFGPPGPSLDYTVVTYEKREHKIDEKLARGIDWVKGQLPSERRARGSER